MAREYFCAYHSYAKQIRKLTDEECGRLFRTLLAFSAGDETAAESLDGRAEIAFDFIAEQIERDAKAYEAKCSKAATSASKRWYESERASTARRSENANASECIADDANASECMRTHKTQCESCQEKEKEDNTPPISPSGGDAPAPSESKPERAKSKTPEPVKKPYGEFKNVMLSDDEYAKLTPTARGLIEEMSCYLKSGDKNYKSHYAALLNWGRRRIKDRGGGMGAEGHDNVDNSFTIDDVNELVEEL